MDRFLHGIFLICLLALPMAALSQEGSAPDDPIESRDMRFNGGNVHFLEAEPEGEKRGTVLLLHGGRFSSENWRELGTLDLLANQGYRVLAIDLPGFGASEATNMPRERFLASLLPLLTDQPVVVVSPSMSGSFSFPLLTRRASYVAGFVALAPVNIEQNLGSLRGNNLPALLIWGQKDKTVPVKEGRQLNDALVNSRLVVFDGAGHPAYFEQARTFHEELLTFLRSLGSP